MSTRIAVIGAGGIATRHVKTLGRFPDVQVTAVADVELSRAQALAAGPGATAYSDVRQMLDTEQLDAVFVCLPPFAHGEPELAVVERGLPFFVEKPLATDLATAERIAAAVQEKGLVTGVGYHWRWLDTVEQVRELLADRPARLALGYWLDFTPPPTWWLREELSGGQIVEQTTHVVDLARHLVGEVDEVFAVAGRTERPAYPDSDVLDVSSATVRFASGAVGSFASTCLLSGPNRIGLHLYAEGLAVELTEFEVRIDDGSGPVVRKAEGNPFEREDRAFVDAVQGGPDRTRTDYAEALRTHRLTTAARQSARDGRAVRLHD